jgi:murein DD-endopeptidase MepM/ murein hydrolase activator NlpD
MARIALAAVVVALLGAGSAHARVSAETAALQVALRAKGLYGGTVDGVAGPGTRAAVRALQARRGLAADGIAGPRTRHALGRLGRHHIGSRPLRRGAVGFDVAALQFALETHGFPCGTVDGGFGWHTDAAVRRLQGFAGLPVDGVAGPATWAALSRPPVRAPGLSRPIAAPVGDRYGPRGAGFHAGLDFPAPSGTRVVAAASGRVIFAGWDDGFGRTVVLDHGNGLHTRYAHLSSIAVRPGTFVGLGTRVGRVGATGFATGPHLHFEVTVRGANADPALALGL